jgi:hypothetical protein
MNAQQQAGDGRRMPSARRAGMATGGTAGVLGSLACGASMILAGIGVGTSTAAAGMAGMDHTGGPTGLLGVLLRAGPALLIASVVLIAAAFALKRPAALAPAVIVGAVLYAGMYAQPNLTLMYLSIVAGYLGWAAIYLWIRATDRAREQRRT